jgi:hypothetical protein
MTITRAQESMQVSKGPGKMKTKAEKKISKVMREYKKGKLTSGSKKGPKVKSRKQAIAIALSEAGKSKRKK